MNACPTRNVCPGDSPTANLSSEAPDPDIFIGQSTGWDNNKPPLGGEWQTSRCFVTYESTLSQADADAKAAAAQLECLVIPGTGNTGPGTVDQYGRTRNTGPWGWTRPDPNVPGVPAPPDSPTPKNDPNLQLFHSTEQSCTKSCPSGNGTASHQTAPGDYVGLTQNFADSVAAAWACLLAEDELICVAGGILGNGCVGSASISRQLDLVISGKNPPYNVEIVGNLPDGYTLVRKDAATFTLHGDFFSKAGDFNWSYKVTDNKGKSQTVTTQFTPSHVQGFTGDTDIDYPDGETNEAYAWKFTALQQNHDEQVFIPDDAETYYHAQSTMDGQVQYLASLQGQVFMTTDGGVTVTTVKSATVATAQDPNSSGGLVGLSVTDTKGNTAFNPQLSSTFAGFNPPPPPIAVAGHFETRPVGSVTFSATDLPPGLILTSDGNLAGVPVKVGGYIMNITINDPIVGMCTYHLPITINGALREEEWCAFTNGFAMEFLASTSLRNATQTWSCPELPGWLSLHATGGDARVVALDGVPGQPAPGIYSFDVVMTATGTNAATGLPDTETIHNKAAVAVLGLTPGQVPPNAKPGKSYTYKVTFLGGDFPPYTLSVFSGNLPPGLTMASDGTISGIATGGNLSYTFNVRLTSSVTGFSCHQDQLTITVNPLYIDWTEILWDAPSITLSSGLHAAADASGAGKNFFSEANGGVGGAGESFAILTGHIVFSIGVNTPSMLNLTTTFVQGSNASWLIVIQQDGHDVIRGTNISPPPSFNFTAIPGHTYSIEARTDASNNTGSPPPFTINISQLGGNISGPGDS